MAKSTMPTRRIARYGWTPDLPDNRDHLYRPKYGALKNIPAKADLTKAKGYFGCYDQLQLGSCTGNAIAAAMQFDDLLRRVPQVTPSRLFIYYNERVIEGTVNTDAGAMIRDGIKVVNTLGAPPESLWPYSDDAKTFKTRPPAEVYTAAKRDTALSYRRLSRDSKLAQFRAAIGVEKKPFVFGFTVYESFESEDVARTGIVPMPAAGESMLGGHAVLAVGYDDSKRRVKVRNSWSDGWGENGHFYMPYDYFTNPSLSADFWLIESTGAPA